MKVSIITVTFNSADTLNDTIESVYNQKYSDIEYILVDGKSKDISLDIINSYKDKFEDRNIIYKWISEEDTGIYDAINKGISMSTGDIVGILNSDDYYYDENVVDDIVKSFNDDDVDCCYGNLEYIDQVTKKVTRRWISKPFENGLFEKSWTPAHPTFYCKKNIYDKYGVYRIDFKIAADVELMYRFLEKNRIKSKFINRNMVTMRNGGVSNNGFRSTYIITKEMMQAFKDNGARLNLFKYLGYKLLKIKEFILHKF